MGIRIEVDTSDVDRELRRLRDGPDMTDNARFDAVLVLLYLGTQRAVHVITGSLKNSGDLDSRSDDGDWYGEITYGGLSPGAIHNPVRYAELEQARGDLHDFMWPTYNADDDYIRAVLAFLRGDL